jgi:RNA-directed DNA polymerase
MVKGRASPDDPDLAGYWRYRRNRHGNPLDTGTLNLLGRQRSRCPLCGDRLIDTSQMPSSPQEREDWWLGVARRRIQHAASAPGAQQPPGQDTAVLSLIHASCNLRDQTRQRRNRQLQPATP